MLLIGGITAGVFGLGNLAAHYLRDDDLGHGKWAKYFFSGALAGFAVGATAYAGWSGIIALSHMGGLWGSVGGIAKWVTLGIEGVHVASTIAGATGGAINNGWRGLGNAGEILLGNFYLDENKSFFGQVWEGILRHTWESLQTGLGYDYSQIRNGCKGSLDRVDFLGGVTFLTDELSGKQNGVSLGNYVNINNFGSIGNTNFDAYVISNPLYMHEYGHTIDSKRYGLSYLFAIGVPSLFSAKFSPKVTWTSAITGNTIYTSKHKIRVYERRANRNSAKYFGVHYGVNWFNYEDYYPTEIL